MPEFPLQSANSSARPVWVLGFHRSATSLLAHLLDCNGFDLESPYVSANAGNPSGYFESRRLVDFHRDWLEETGTLFEPFGGTCGFCRSLPPQPDETGVTLPAPGELMKDGWKDPRTLLSLPFWAARFPDFRAIVIVRHPLECHFSLLRRGDWIMAIDPLIGLLNYHLYFAALPSVVRQFPRQFHLVTTEDLFCDWNGSVDRMEGFLQRRLSRREEICDSTSFRSHHWTPARSKAFETFAPNLAEMHVRLKTAARSGTISSLSEAFPPPDTVRDVEDLAAVEAAWRAEFDAVRRRAEIRVEMGRYMEILRRHERMLSGELWTACHSIDEMTRTLSWRLTAPLRWLRKRFAGRVESR